MSRVLIGAAGIDHEDFSVQSAEALQAVGEIELLVHRQYDDG